MQNQTAFQIKVFVGIIAVLMLITAVLALLFQKKEIVAPPVTTEVASEPQVKLKPTVLPESQKQLQSVQEQLHEGTLTEEEAQKKIVEIVTKNPPLPPIPSGMEQ